MGSEAPARDPSSMHSATTTYEETDMSQMAYRINTGVALSLLWNRRRNELSVEQSPQRERRTHLERSPHAYAAAHRNETFDRIAARGPLF
jgi:hypothetical protein